MATESDKAGSLPDPEDWVDRYGDYLYRYALLRLKDPDRAEDIVQETFLAALRSRINYRRLSSERTWLVGILKHKIIDYLRRASRERRRYESGSLGREQDQAFDEDGSWRIEPPRWDTQADEALEWKEFWDVFERCLSELPSRLYGSFVLKEIEQLSTKQICKELGITPTNLMVRMHRTRRLLRDCLESNWFGVDKG